MKMTTNVALLAFAGVVGTAAVAADKPLSFRAVDTNHDGRISKQEARSFAAVEMIFNKADKDRNGLLDKKEFEHGEAQEKAQKK